MPKKIKFDDVVFIRKIKKVSTIFGIVLLFVSLIALAFILLIEVAFQWTSIMGNLGNITFVYYIAAVSATIAFGCFTLSFSLKTLEENHSKQRQTQNDLTEKAIKCYLDFISTKGFLYVYEVLNETIVKTGLHHYAGECIDDEAKFNADVLRHTSSPVFNKELENSIMRQSRNKGLTYDEKIRDEFVFETIKIFNELNHICYLCLNEYVIVDNFRRADCDVVVKDLYIFGKILRLYNVVAGDEIFVTLFMQKMEISDNI